MFAPPLAKVETKHATRPASGAPRRHPTLPAHRPGQQPAEQVLMLQRILGNQATRRLLAQQGPWVAGEAVGQGHAEAAAPGIKQSGIMQSGIMQPGRVAGDAGHPLERDAGRAADHLIHRAAPMPSGGDATLQRACATCEDAVVQDVLRSTREPRDAQSRGLFEPQLGRDVPAVRMHADARAAEPARGDGNRAVQVVAFPGAAVLQRAGDRSRQSKPTNAPRGTKPIDQSGLDKDEVHGIKDQIGAGPKDWVGITPDQDVITSDADGNAVDNGKVSDFIHRSSTAESHLPGWLAGLLGAAALVAVAACFATGVCEFGAVVAGLGAATAAAVIAVLHAAGVTDSGGSGTTASNDNPPPAEDMPTMTASAEVPEDQYADDEAA